jgi:ABC-type lipoprotein export system ATPase subunit
VPATSTPRTVTLDSVICTLPTEDLFALNGPSGSSTSTLLKLLPGIDRSTIGQVVFVGQERRTRGKNMLAQGRQRHIAPIGQHGTGAIVVPVAEVQV